MSAVGPARARPRPRIRSRHRAWSCPGMRRRRGLDVCRPALWLSDIVGCVSSTGSEARLRLWNNPANAGREELPGREARFLRLLFIPAKARGDGPLGRSRRDRHPGRERRSQLLPAGDASPGSLPGGVGQRAHPHGSGSGPGQRQAHRPPSGTDSGTGRPVPAHGRGGSWSTPDSTGPEVLAGDGQEGSDKQHAGETALVATSRGLHRPGPDDVRRMGGRPGARGHQTSHHGWAGACPTAGENTRPPQADRGPAGGSHEADAGGWRHPPADRQGFPVLHQQRGTGLAARRGDTLTNDKSTAVVLSCLSACEMVER